MSDNNGSLLLKKKKIIKILNYGWVYKLNDFFWKKFGINVQIVSNELIFMTNNNI